MAKQMRKNMTGGQSTNELSQQLSDNSDEMEYFAAGQMENKLLFCNRKCA